MQQLVYLLNKGGGGADLVYPMSRLMWLMPRADLAWEHL